MERSYRQINDCAKMRWQRSIFILCHFNVLTQLIHYIIFCSFTENKLHSSCFLLLMMFLYISLQFGENTENNMMKFSMSFPQLQLYQQKYMLLRKINKQNLDNQERNVLAQRLILCQSYISMRGFRDQMLVMLKYVYRSLCDS